MKIPELTLVHQGKVRDTYALPEENLLMPVASDRMSIFDFVLPTVVPHKGELLTAMTVFWLDDVLKDITHHLVAFGSGIDEYLPPSLRGQTELHKRALVVKKLPMLPVECIVRGYLTGSGWKSYQQTQQVCGIDFPGGLHDGSRILPGPIFTPTTKAQTGHDQPLNTEDVIQQYGTWLRDLSLDIYQKIADVSKSKKLIIADTKFEFGQNKVLADEVGTPDSSRFWDYEEWQQACEKHQSPPPFDKEIVRNWGKQYRLGDLNPERAEDKAFVQTLHVPQAVLEETTLRYHAVFHRLTGQTLIEFQKSKLGVA